MTTDQVGGILRAIFAGIGGILVQKGYVDNATATATVGGIVTTLVAIWSYYTNRPGLVPSSK